jgi:ABC-type Mn2+/Zn2+ transport system ATPase subunit
VKACIAAGHVMQAIQRTFILVHTTDLTRVKENIDWAICMKRNALGMNR